MDEDLKQDTVEMVIDGVLDLHTFKPEDVKDLVLNYLDVCLEKGITDVRIIHGKGIGVLARIVRSVLKQHPHVVSYKYGGSWGVTVATLRSLKLDSGKEEIMELVLGCTTRPYNFLSFAEACEHIAAAGYTDVAVFANKRDDGSRAVPVRADSTAKEIAAARKAAADAGVVPSMVIGSTNLALELDAAVDNYKKLIDNVAELGTTWLLDCGTGKEELYDKYYELMKRSAPHAGEMGVNITLKPHGGITLTVEGLTYAYNTVNNPAFGICFDPGNIIYYTKGEMRPETDVDKVAPMVTTGIIKDCVVENGKPDVMVTPGEGLVDFEKVLAGLINGGFDGPLYVECVGGKELDEIDKNVKSTHGFVENILAKL